MSVSSHFPPNFPPFFSHSESCSYVFHPDLFMILHCPPFPPPISPHFPPFFQAPNSWFGELVGPVAVSAEACSKLWRGGIAACCMDQMLS